MAPTLESIGGRSPLYANQYFPLACMGDPANAEALAARYADIRRDLAPQVLEHVKKVVHGEGPAVALALVGSSATFTNFRDIDINVIHRGHTIEVEQEKLTFTHPRLQWLTPDIRVGLYYVGIEDMDSLDYVRFAYKKPIIWGRISPLFRSELRGALASAIKSSLHNANGMLDSIDRTGPNGNNQSLLRASLHYEMNACRYLHTKWSLTRKKAPQLFPGVVRSLHKMDNNGEYDEPSIQKILAVLEQWRAGNPGPVSTPR